MPDRRTEAVGREAGQAIADSIIDALEASLAILTNAIRAVREDQAEAREELHALKQRVESLERVLASRTDHLA